LFNGDGIDGPGYSITLALSDGRQGKSISISESPYIMIDRSVYQVGYWGNSKVIALGAELKAVLALRP